MNNPLLDTEFLKELYEHREKETYAKIIALNFQEEPIEEIQGRVTSGNVNLDGSSAVRRACNLTMVAQEMNINDFYWGLNSKFKLEIGLKVPEKVKNFKRTIYRDELKEDIYPYKNYGDIIWFKQGTYVLTSFNTQQTTNNYNVSIQGKDKMCLLNGELGGNVTAASWDFGKIDVEVSPGVWKRESYPIKQIIKDAVHTYAKEPWEKILINGLEDYGLELLEYRGSRDKPLYLIFGATEDNVGQVANMTFDGSKNCWDENGDMYYFDNRDENPNKLIYDPRIELNFYSENISVTPTKIYLTKPTAETIKTLPLYTVAKVEYGQTVGYRLTDLTYAGDLILSVGEPITSLLDKIVKMLGNFEYFYDLNGNFIFQEKPTFIQTTFNNIVDNRDETYVDNNAYTSASVWNFEGGLLLTAFTNTPNLTKLKNDYSLWGVKKSITGQELPVHVRYAIDKKPVYYKNFKGEVFSVEEGCDWRELIYQMAKDFDAYNHEDTFLTRVRNNNGFDEYGEYYYSTGYTGYEQYYTDLEGFWRELYCTKESEKVSGITYNKDGWNTQIINEPDRLNFWFDFLDPTGETGDAEMAKYMVSAVGDRTKALNDKDIKGIYFRETPTVIFTEDIAHEDRKQGYTYLQIQGNMDSLFAVSSQGKSAIDVLNENLYNYSYCIETASITAVPIYHLETNTRIYINDKNSHINGQYIVSKISIPLQYNGTMSITATKAADRIL